MDYKIAQSSHFQPQSFYLQSLLTEDGEDPRSSAISRGDLLRPIYVDQSECDSGEAKESGRIESQSESIELTA